MSLQNDYMINNLLAKMNKLEQRIAALERRGEKATGAADANPTGATPDDALPSAASIVPLYLVEETTGDLYRLACRIMNGQARLLLRRVGPLRTEG